MSEQTDNILNLIKLYLSEEEGRIYLFLLSCGFASALNLSRDLKIGRTKVYRLLDLLQKKRLVEMSVDDRGMKFGATHPSMFQQLITEQEQQISTLKSSLPNLISHLTAINPKSDPDSKVLYYEGIEGLKQISYNITKAKGLLRVFEMEHLSDFLPKEFAEMVREKLVENKITTHDLTNKTSFPDYTNVTEMVKKFSEFRYVNPEKLKIEFEVLIYNNVYATYSYKEGKIFCVEIYNEQLASMQKQIFNFIWDQAKPMNFVSPKGAARITT